MPQWKWGKGEELIIFKVVICKAIELLLAGCRLSQTTVQRYTLSATWQNYFFDVRVGTRVWCAVCWRVVGRVGCESVKLS